MRVLLPRVRVKPNPLGFSVFTVVLMSSLLRAQQPTTTTAPSDALIGRWRVLSIGAKKLPANIPLFWTFDKQDVIVTTGNGDIASKSQYVIRPDGDHMSIYLTPDGKSEADRVGWFEMKDRKLRIQVTLGTGKPPTAWNEDEVMLFQPQPKK